ncbi:S8 family serine peptidase [Pedobacter aquatilis]|uniref:S8 family serine peptidase n=1 Tax=Pedobacter aquatilis TaxID=351343 RepID=UPI00292F7B39|nr:S8 family serine peptidase [Pedobacter aquatilis]
MQKNKRQNYILLPINGTEVNVKNNPKVADFLSNMDNHFNMPELSASMTFSARNMASIEDQEIEVTVLDSIKSNGAKLVTLDNQEMASFRFSYPGLRIIPEKFYELSATRESILNKITSRFANTTVDILITDKDGNPVEGALVIAFTNYKNRQGADGKSNTSGRVKLKLNKSKIERLLVYPAHSFWGIYKKNLEYSVPLHFKLDTIDLAADDSLRHFYPTRTYPPIENKIRIGVIDTGIGPHVNLPVGGGKNLVTDEEETDFSDLDGHGTHVAGIIAGIGDMPGLAAGVDILAYKVFPKDEKASNFYIMKAIEQAIHDKCDLINMSLGEEELDEGLTSSIKDAYDAGILCFAANGNDYRSPVSFPAAYSLSIAVSAFGRKDTFPNGTTQVANVSAPYGIDNKNFVADFSNSGPETDLTAPGVGIISTVPDDKYAVMDGTSMACPAAVGAAARLLSTRPDLLKLKRDQTRADEILKFLSKNIQPIGFGATFEGKGMLII